MGKETFNLLLEMLETIQGALADFADKLSPYMVFLFTLVIICLIIVNLKFEYPKEGEPLWTDSRKREVIKNGLGAFVLSSLIGLFLQSTRSVYSLLLIPSCCIGNTLFFMGSYVIGLYLYTESRRGK